MFRSKKIGIDAARSSSRGSTQVNLKKVRGRSSSKLHVKTVPPRYSTPGLARVPEEYRTLERGRRGGWGFLVFLFLLFVASVAGFFYWNNRAPEFQGDSVYVTVTAEENIISGNEVTYVIEYENQDFVTLKTVELDVQWPEGFYYNDSSQSPTSESATTWILGPLDPGQKKQIRIKGQLVGLKDQIQTAIFRLSYRPENINSDFEVKQVVETLIADAKIDLALASNTKVISGQEVSFVATVTNLTSERLNDIDIEVILPKDFEMVSSEPPLDDNHWRGSLSSGDPLELSITAKAVDDADGEQVWVVEISENIDNQVRRLLRKELVVTPIKPEFDIDLKINGQSRDFEVEYGETLNYQLKIKNRSSSVMSGIKVTALLDSDVIDRKTVQSTGVTEQQSIVWTKNHVEQLGGLEPDQEVIIPWKATLLEQGTIGRASVDAVVTLEIEGLPAWRDNSPVFIVSVGEGLVFNQGVYWDLGGATVGTGNLPPVTNEKTEYLVIWSLDSGSQDFDSVNVSVFLPQKVTFVATEEVDEGAVKFDEETRRIEWQINNFSSKLLPLKATYFIKLVPEDEDEGTVMTLMNPATVVASGDKIFEAKSFSITTEQVITTEEGEIGVVIE